MHKPMSLLLTTLGDYIGQTRTIILFADGSISETGSGPAILAHPIARHQKTEDRPFACIPEATREQAGAEPSDGGDDGH